MAYATQQDMIERFGEREIIELTNREIPRGDTVDADVLDRALEDAAGDVDSRLAGRFSVPLPNTPHLINRLCCDLARFYLYENAATEQVTKRYEMALKTLTSIAKGEIRIGVDEAGNEPSTSGGEAEMHSGGRVFGRDDRRYI